MTSKQRVHAALKKEPLDRVPIFMWYHPQTAKRLAKILEIAVNFLGEALGDDILMTWVNNNYAMEGIVHQNDGESHVDEWGIEWTRIDGFNQITHYPLANAAPDEIVNYKFPNDKIDSLIKRMEPLEMKKENYFIGCDVSPSAFELCWRLRGMENAMIDIANNPKVAESMIHHCAEFSLRLSEAACERFELDWLWAGDDIAGQTGMMLSPQTWRVLIKPHLKLLFDVAKENGIYAAFHSCGAIRSIINDLVEMGLDVLNPIQCNCTGMDPFELKKEFGKDLAFMGGVDTQYLLPNGTPDQIYRETLELIQGMTSDGGGYILAASHTVPPETPNENIFAMYEAAGLSKEEIFDRSAQIRCVQRNML